MHQWNVILRDGEREVRYEFSSEKTMALMAGLSGDPESIDELVACTRRFMGDRWHEDWLSDHQSTSQASPGIGEDYCIDLPGRLIVHSTRSPEPPRVASVRVYDHVREEPYITEHHLSREWEIRPWSAAWRDIAEQRREPRRIWLRDCRRVLYDDLAAGIVKSWREELRVGRAEKSDASSLEELAKSNRCELSQRTLSSLISRIHTRWLLTPLEGLQGKTPREMLVAHVEHIRLDIGQRVDQWIATGREAEEVASSSSAYRGAYVGPVELTFYHQLVEKLIRRLLYEVLQRSLGEQIRQQPVHEFKDGVPKPIATHVGNDQFVKFWSHELKRINLDALPDDQLLQTQSDTFVDEVLARELIKLLQWEQSEFLDQPEESLCGFSPGQLTTMERKRLPILVDREFSPTDCDCPLCVMLEHQASLLLWDPATDWFPTDFVFSRSMTFDQWSREFDESEIDAAWRRPDDTPQAFESGNRDPGEQSGLPGRQGNGTASSAERAGEVDSVKAFDLAMANTKRQMAATARLEYRCLVRMFETPFIMTVTVREHDDALTASPAFQMLFEVGAVLATMISLIKDEKRKSKKRASKEAVKQLNDRFRELRDIVTQGGDAFSIEASLKQFRHAVHRYAGRFSRLDAHVEPLMAALHGLQAAMEETLADPAKQKR